MTSWLVIFRAFFFFFFFFFFLNISIKNSKTSKVNTNSLYHIFKYFIIFLHRTITFNSVILKNTQTEPQTNIIFFHQN